MSNSLKFGNKIIFANGNAITLAVASSDPGTPSQGDMYFNSTTNVVRVYNGTIWMDVNTNSLTGLTLSTNNTIVGNGSNLSAAVDTSSVGDVLADSTTGLTVKSGAITNAKVSASAAIAYTKLNLSGSIVNADVATAAAIALSKLAALTASKVLVSDGSGVISASSVSTTTLGYLDATSSIQTQINSKISSSEKGANNGVATLDSGGKIPVGQLPNSVMEFQGNWDADTNTPTLADGVGSAGDVYRVNVAGSQDLGSGSISYIVGDWAVYNGTIWEKAHSGADSVLSVNGSSGVVVLTTSDIAEGSNLYFTTERAQDAVGGALTDTSTIDFTYDDSGNSITADVKSNSITNTQINSSAAIAYSKLNLASSVKASDMNSESATLGQVLTADGSGGATYTDANSGTVTSVAVTVPSILSVSGSPITTSGTIAITLATEAANKVFAGPTSGGSATPTFRSLVAADIPSLTATYASLALDNLASVALNTSLIPGTNNSINLGSASKDFANAYVGTVNNPNGTLTLTSADNVAMKATIVKQSDSPSSTNFKETQYFDAVTLDENTSSFTTISSLNFAHASFRGAIVDYTIREATSNSQRIGRLYIATDGTTSSSSDQYSETAQLGSATGLALQAIVNGANIEVQFNNTDASNACTLRCEVTRFRA